MTATAHGIEIENDSEYAADAPRLIAAARAVIAQHGLDSLSGVQIVLTDDETVRALNATYRDVDSVTDVLSFTAEPLPAEILAETGDAPYLGDLVIAWPYASAQAQTLGHPLSDSIALLVVHGTLHLLGYDHDTPENRAKMWAAQALALAELGISEALVPALEAGGHD